MAKKCATHVVLCCSIAGYSRLQVSCSVAARALLAVCSLHQLAGTVLALFLYVDVRNR